MDTWTSPELVITLKLPNDINIALRYLYAAYKAKYPNSTGIMNNIQHPHDNSFPITCMVWNVQGAGSREFLSVLKEIIRINKPVVLALVETHMGGDRALKIAQVLGYNGHTRVDAQGFSGGIWVYWRSELVTIDPIIQHQQYITMEVTKVGATPWYFSAIYASPDPTRRQELWQELTDFAQHNNKPWILAGDFNETRFGWERSSSCSSTTTRSNQFNAWVEENCLIEVEFSGQSHTWSRGNSVDTWHSARLDRALCNTEWSLLFDTARVRHLPALQSDHCPLLISPNGFAPIAALNRPFRFQAAWLTHEHFSAFVKENWKSNVPLVPFLAAFSKALQAWNRDHFYNIFRRKRELMARINGIQTALACSRQSGLIKLGARLRKELDTVLQQEELLWFQKARVEWLKDGDRNTTFFHLSTIVRRWRTTITAIKNDADHWVYDKKEIQHVMVDYFSKLFMDEGTPTEYAIPSGVCTELSSTDWDNLNRPYSKCDIDFVVKNMGAMKAPGPDGFQAIFYQKNWDIVSPSVYETVLSILDGKGLPPGINETFLVLIPKVDKPERPTQFRPIGLCNVIYKIVTKAIVNRIKPLLPVVTSCTQTSFIPGRQITDNIVIVQEVLHTMKRKQSGKGYMTIKIDFEKAYDRLKWDFIRNTLEEMNFPIRMVEVIMECITSPTMRVLWNGEPSEVFQPSRGIRQGDPLSPYLFVLCMERFNQVIEEAIIQGHWKPIYASRGGPKLSNLFFADDIILFAEASSSQAQIIQDCLNRFCSASGQKVSLPKSRVYFSKNVSTADRENICAQLGMEVTEDLGTYLGMPTLTSRVTKETYGHLCEKMDRRLSGWKTKYLSLAGRITLAKSTLSALATYSMQTTKIPRTIFDELDKRTRRFVWGGSEDKKSIHLLSWETLLLPRDKGGLGIRSSRQANAAFLTKLGWRVLSEPNSLWSRVLRHKYCKGRCDIDMFTPSRNISHVWRGITENAHWINKGSAVAVGNGCATLFWDHCWVSDNCLRDLSMGPIPPEIEGATVGEMWEDNEGWKWDLFAHLLPPLILKNIAALKLTTNPELGDLRYWKGSTHGGFSIKHAMKIMREDQAIPSHPKWDIIWRLPVQQRIRVFLWLLLHERLLCNTNRVMRHLAVDPRCARCTLQQDESLLHVFRDCTAARQLWAQIGGPARSASFFSGSLQSWLLHNLNPVDPNLSEKWVICFALTLWWNWRWRNSYVFGRPNDIPVDTGAFLNTQITSTWHAFFHKPLLASSSQNGGTREIFIRWLAPPGPWIILNTDGASKNPHQLAGGGGLLRDSRGMFIRGFSASFGSCSAYKAELMAVTIGLEMAKALGITKLEVQMDNKACIEAIQNANLHGGECVHLLSTCRSLIQSEHWEVRMAHCYREGNKVADRLANMGVVQRISMMYHEAPPPDISTLLREDIMGVTTPRLVIY